MTLSVGPKCEKGNLEIRRAVPLSVRSGLSIPSRAEGEKGLKDRENWNMYVGGRSVGANLGEISEKGNGCLFSRLT